MRQPIYCHAVADAVTARVIRSEYLVVDIFWISQSLTLLVFPGNHATPLGCMLGFLAASLILTLSSPLKLAQGAVVAQVH